MTSFLRAAAFAISLATAGCMTHTRPLNIYEQHELRHVYPTIDDSSEIARYFAQEGRQHLGTEQTSHVEDALHALLEDAFEATLDERVRFTQIIHYEPPGHTLQIARRGELEIISARILSNEDLSLRQSETLEMLAAYLGPAIHDVRLDSEGVRGLVELLEQRDAAAPPRQAATQRAIDAYLDRHFPGQTPRYAGYTMTMGGFALDFLLFHYIRIDPDQASLHGWVDVLSHEIGHTLIFLDASLSYKAQFLAGYLNWSDNDAIVTIHETACNVIADRVTPIFFARHVDPDSEIYRAFAQHGEVSQRHLQTMLEILADYGTIPRHERIERRDDIFDAYRARLATDGFSPRVINEAYLALQDRYSGGGSVRERLDDITDAVGVRGLIHIVPYLHTQDDLRIVHERVQRGIRGREIIRPIEHAHDLVDLGSAQDMPL